MKSLFLFLLKVIIYNKLYGKTELALNNEIKLRKTYVTEFLFFLGSYLTWAHASGYQTKMEPNYVY